jgi:pseudaminic acid cytidylyltransferase
MNINAIIPIRSGSKRFPNKNIYNISGVPLFIFAADVARKSGIFNKIIVSSDSQEYLNIANDFGYFTHLRSFNTSKDISTTEEVISEVILYFGLPKNDWVFLIQATCPFQQQKYFIGAAEKINSKVKSILTFRKFNRFFIDDVVNGIRKRTQDIQPKLLETGLFWAMNVGDFLSENNRIITPYEMIEIEECDDVDVDYSSDLKFHLTRLELISNEINKNRQSKVDVK